MTSKKLVQNTLSKDSFLLVNKKILKELKNANAAIILSSLISKYNYFESKGELQDDYFFNTKEMLIEELGLSEEVILTAEKLLVKFNLISTKLQGLPRKKYYLINWDRISEILSDSYIILKPTPTKKYLGTKYKGKTKATKSIPTEPIIESAIITPEIIETPINIQVEEPIIKSPEIADSQPINNRELSKVESSVLELEKYNLESLLIEADSVSTRDMGKEIEDIYKLLDLNERQYTLNRQNRERVQFIKDLISFQTL